MSKNKLNVISGIRGNIINPTLELNQGFHGLAGQEAHMGSEKLSRRTGYNNGGIGERKEIFFLFKIRKKISLRLKFYWATGTGELTVESNRSLSGLEGLWSVFLGSGQIKGVLVP